MPKRAVTPPGGKKGHHIDQTAAASTPGGGSKAAETEHGSPRPSSPFPAISLRRTRFSSVPLVQLKHADTEEITFPASVELPRRHVTFYSDVDSDSSLSGGGLCSMSDTMESFKELGASPSTQPSVRIKHLTRNSDGTSRFPKLDECAHFHYDNVELGPISVVLSEGDDRVDAKSSCASEWWFCVQVTSNGKSWQVRRSLDNFQMLDRQLHRCVYDRKFSLLKEISVQPQQPEDALRTMLTQYLERFSQLAGSLINCGPVLNWLELDNRGNRLIVTDEAAINTPAVAAAYVIKRYASQASDEISLEVGDIISVIDMPPPEESSWWRGKKGFQVGFFPCECVEIIGDKVPQSIKIPKAPAKPVLRKHGKLIAFFRSFLLSRPSRRKLKQSGILKERVFGCDLGEHLMNTGRDIPLVLKCCTEFIEQHGIVDGIYRLSGVTSNIQKLRLAFDEDRVPNLMDEAIVQDIHCVASLLKMYFRELPNPLLTFHLYDKFVNAVQADEDMRLLKLRDVVQQLPPPHYRSLEYLMRHLSKVAAHGFQTGMTPKNVAIVWAPNLLRSRDIENGGVGALHVVGVQAVLTEYLIRYTDIIFSEKMPIFPSPVLGEETPKKTRPKSLAISTPTKLLSLEEARSRALTSNLPGEQQKFIDVGGGEENLPIKYHTVIELPVRRRSMGKGKKSPSGWRSFFSRGWHTTSGRRKSRRSRTEGQSERPKIGSPIFSEHSPLVLQDKAVTESDVFHTDAKKLRSVKSAESLFPLSSNLSQQITDYEFTPVDEITASPPESVDFDIAKEITPSSFAKSTYQKHMRSTSHDSYFERLIDFQMDDELDLDEDSLLEMKPLQKPTSAVNQIRSSAVEEDICHAQSAKDSLGRNKTAHKQKLVSFDSEASSPKLQKLSLKRLYHTLSSPPMVKKKDFSKKEKNNENLEKQPLVQSELMIVDDNLDLEKCRTLKQDDAKVEFQKNEESDIVEQTSSSEQTRVPLRETLTCVPKLEQEMEISALHKKDSVPVEIHREYQDLNMSHVNEEENFEKLDQQSMTVSESQNASIHDDADDNEISFSVEATRSDSVSLSQLLSFDGDQVVSVGNSASKDKQLEHSVGLQNGSVTPESPTGDNVSEIPSSADSEAGDIASELGKQVASESVLNEIQNNHLFNNASCLCESDEKDDKITKQDENAEEKLANETELLQITNNVNITYKQKEETEAIFSPVPSEIGISQDSDRHLALDSNFVENIILSPPENFVDKSPTATVQKQNGNLASKLVNDIKISAKSPGARSLERSMTEVHEICPKFVSGIAVSGSLGHELFRANSEFVDSSLQKKRSCSDKLSPISPIEESRRKFESEIGRLIVRDRQMKLEMEQIKAERQRYKTEKSFPEVDKSRLKNEKKFVDALDFRKSPVKSFDSDRKKMDQDDVLKSLRETADDKKTSEMAFTHGYSRYIRMENKPSVKELLSKFEGHKKQSDICERTDSVASPKQSQSVFSNVQVINHNIPLTSSKSLSSSFADSNQSCKDNQISHTKEHIFQTECVVRFPHPKASFLTQDWNKNGSINSDTYDSFGSRSWTSGQCDHRTKVNNSRTAFLSSDNLMTSSVQSNSYGSFSTSPFEGSSPQSLTTEQNNKSKSVESNWLSEQLHSGKSHQADRTAASKVHQKYSESDENSFSSFQQTYTRSGSMTSKMRTEFLQQGISQPLCENGRSVLTPEKFNAFDGSHYSRSSFESRKRNSTSRQRPKSVPPPVCRLSFVSSTPYPPAQLTQTCSISVSKQAETPLNNVPKTSSINLSNGQESSDTSQTCGPSKRIRDRAAIFERSLSFSGYTDKKPYSSSKHSQKAQANSSAR